jgi:SAM-dependent methyltransferase
MKDALGQALWDYYHKQRPAKLWICNNYGPKEEMPVKIYFRKEADMPELELKAIEHCRGAVLDIGAGAGSHALLLQQKGCDVTALDISPKAAEVMGQRGVKKVIVSDIFLFGNQQFDTLLLLMNGIGLAGTITRLRILLQHLKEILLPGGQVICDSSDIAYLYEGKMPNATNYYGEIAYEYGYKGTKSGWFKWVYVDKSTLAHIARQEGWATELLFEDGNDQYLVRLTTF